MGCKASGEKPETGWGERMTGGAPMRIRPEGMTVDRALEIALAVFDDAGPQLRSCWIRLGEGARR